MALGCRTAWEVLLEKMGTALKSAEESARRYAEGISKAVCEALERPRDQAQYDWGLTLAAGDTRKLTRKGNRQGIITLSAAMLRDACLAEADRVIVLPLPEGGLLVRGATAEDVREAHARCTGAPQPCFPCKPALADLHEVEKRCPQCGLAFRTRQRRRVYCDVCKRERELGSHRATWHRIGKLRPSYRRKLKSLQLALPHSGSAGSSILIRPT